VKDALIGTWLDTKMELVMRVGCTRAWRHNVDDGGRCCFSLLLLSREGPGSQSPGESSQQD
jgi:hypothetical protein